MKDDLSNNSALASSESQNIEFKQSWHDDYLKWVCGFANAVGGRIYLGKDDHGQVVGLKNAKKLLEDLPNKIRDHLGLMPSIHLQEVAGKSFIEIIVEPSTVPISLRGAYYWRSGSVKQELKGTALNEFLLKKMGLTWDRAIEGNASLDDIDEATIELFKKEALTAGRLPDISELSPADLLKSQTSSGTVAGGSEDDFRPITDGTSGKRRESLGKTSGNGLGNGLGNGVGNELGNTKVRILSEMKQSPKITGSQLAEILEISTTAVEKHIKQLRESGLIQRVGGTRGYWEVLEKS